MRAVKEGNIIHIYCTVQVRWAWLEMDFLCNCHSTKTSDTIRQHHVMYVHVGRAMLLVVLNNSC